MLNNMDELTNDVTDEMNNGVTDENEMNNGVTDKMNNDDMIFYNNNNKYYSGGFSVNSVLLNSNIPVFTVYNDKKKKNNTETDIFNIFDGLAIPTGISCLNTYSNDKNNKNDKNDNTTVKIVESKLFDTLYDIVYNNKKKINNTKKYKKQLKNNKTRKNI